MNKNATRFDLYYLLLTYSKVDNNTLIIDLKNCILFRMVVVNIYCMMFDFERRIHLKKLTMSAKLKQCAVKANLMYRETKLCFSYFNEFEQFFIVN